MSRRSKYIPLTVLSALVLAFATPVALADVVELRARRAAPRLVLPYFEADLINADGVQTLFSVSNASSAPALLVRLDFYDLTGLWLATATRFVARTNTYSVAALVGANLDICGDGVFLISQSAFDPLLDADGVARGFLVMRAVETCVVGGPDEAVEVDSGLIGDVKYLLGGIGAGGGQAQGFDLVTARSGRHTISFVGEVGNFDGTELLLFADGEPFPIEISGRTQDGAPILFGDLLAPAIPLDVGGAVPVVLADVIADLDPNADFGDLIIDSPDGKLIVWARLRAGSFSIGQAALLTRLESFEENAGGPPSVF